MKGPHPREQPAETPLQEPRSSDHPSEGASENSDAKIVQLTEPFPDDLVTAKFDVTDKSGNVYQGKMVFALPARLLKRLREPIRVKPVQSISALVFAVMAAVASAVATYFLKDTPIIQVILELCGLT